MRVRMWAAVAVCATVVCLFQDLVWAGYLYVLNDVDGGANLLFGFEVNEQDGSLTALPGFPRPSGGNGSQNLMSQRMTYDPVNGCLYLLNGGSNTISAFAVDATTGALEPLPFNPFSLPPGPAGPPNRWSWGCLAVHPGGSPLVIGRDQLDQSHEPGQLASFNVSPAMAVPAAGSPFYAGDLVYPYACAFSCSGKYLYTGGNRTTTRFGGFEVDAGTGVLSPLAGSPYTSDGYWPLAFALDGLDRLFLHSYHGQVTGQVETFLLSSGIPAAVPGAPAVSRLDDGIFALLHPAGYYLVADRSLHQVGVYRITGSSPATTLAAVPGSPFPSGAYGTTALALNTAGTYLFAANNWTRNLTTFAVDSATGALNRLTIQPVNSLGTSGYITGLVYVGGLTEPQPGDLNLDGRVNCVDVVLLGRLLDADLLDCQVPAPWNGDLDQDGRLTVADLLQLRLQIC